ncbi:MAG: hypothetical protein ABIS26_01490 [Candidatus Paceibacterota bacterium]
MIYLFSGNDTSKKLLNYDKFMASIDKAIEIFPISKNDFNEMQLESFYSGPSLFSSTSAVVFSGILESVEHKDFVLNKLEQMVSSTNLFIFLEGKLNKPIIDAFKKSKAEINIFETPKEKTDRFDSFLIANAFSQKDKLNVWIYFRQAIERGAALEEIVGILFWKIKDMIVKKDFSKFSEDVLKDSAAKLSYILPQARKRGQDAEAELEQFLLEAF